MLEPVSVQFYHVEQIVRERETEKEMNESVKRFLRGLFRQPRSPRENLECYQKDWLEKTSEIICVCYNSPRERDKQTERGTETNRDREKLYLNRFLCAGAEAAVRTVLPR